LRIEAVKELTAVEHDPSAHPMKEKAEDEDENEDEDAGCRLKPEACSLKPSFQSRDAEAQRCR
jgi:hypothetical protein